MKGENKTTALLYEQAEVLIVAIMRFMVLGRQKHLIHQAVGNLNAINQNKKSTLHK